jgi:hypothetical protein
MRRGIEQAGWRMAIAAAAAMLTFALVCGSAMAGELSGTIKNGTDGKPGASLDVILIKLQGGMQPVETIKSDAHGNFKFDRPEIGQAPMLVRVPFRGVNYHTPVPPGTSTIEVEIFNPTDKASAVQVTQHDIVVQPSNGTLLVGEEFSVENHTNPPVAFFRNDGTFNFTIPAGAQIGQVSAWSAAGMPVTQGPIDKSKGVTAVAFPFRPGKNGVRLSYTVPYPGNHANLQLTSLYAVPSVFLVAPPTMQISGAGFTPGGQQEGWNIYGHDAVAANASLEVNIAGTAPPPSDDANAGGGGGGAGGAGSAGAAGGAGANGASDPSVNSRASSAGETVTMPGRMDNVKWVLVAGFGALFALGLIFLWRRPAASMAVAGGGGVSASIPAQAAAPTVSSRVSQASSVASAGSQAGAGIAEMDKEVRGGLDELKEKLFRLELRHQAGTISEEDYTRSRAQVEQTLRELVRG